MTTTTRSGTFSASTPPPIPKWPTSPEGLILTPGATGSLYSDWANARRANRYRVFIQVIGTDANFRYVDTVTESNYLFTGLPSGATVKVRITAANDAGETAPSAEVQATVA